MDGGVPAVGAHRCPRRLGGYGSPCLAFWQFGDGVQALLLAHVVASGSRGVESDRLLRLARNDGRPDGHLQRGSYGPSAALACLACSHSRLVAWVEDHSQSTKRAVSRRATHLARRHSMLLYEALSRTRCSQKGLHGRSWRPRRSPSPAEAHFSTTRQDVTHGLLVRIRARTSQRPKLP